MISNFIILQFGSPRAPSSSNIIHTLIMLGIVLSIELGLYIFKEKLRSWIRPLMFTTILAIMIFLFTYIVVKKKEVEYQNAENQKHEQTL